MTKFIEEFENIGNYKQTENGADAFKSTKSKVYDLFAFGGAYRSRHDNDCILLFKEAFEEDEDLALKCLFYLRDILSGQGERRFFRVCYRWLCNNYPIIAKKNLCHIPTFGRWDDLIYIAEGTAAEESAFQIIVNQLREDLVSNAPSLLAKWLPSENASSKESKRLAKKIRQFAHISSKKYRKALSFLRKKIKVLERLMSSRDWDAIEFDKIPSVAGLKYKDTFLTREETKERYTEFIKDKETKVNAKALYPYNVVHQAIQTSLDDTDAVNVVEKYWQNLPDYLGGKPAKIMCVCDTSGSMTWSGRTVAPIDVAVSLSIYCAERIGEPFKNHYISFSSRPELITIKGVNFVDKVNRIARANLCENTNLAAVFDLLLELCKGCASESIPETIVVISDMEIDNMTYSYPGWRDSEVRKTTMQKIKDKWAAAGIKCPKLVYWNVEARNNTILDEGEDVSFVSGCSPVLFEQVLTGKCGYDLMIDKLINSKRYDKITI